MKKLALLLVVAVAAACSPDASSPRATPEESSPGPSTISPRPDTSATKSGDQTIPLQVWFLSEERDEPVLRLHYVNVPRTQAVARAALEQLLSGVPDDLRALDRRAWSAVPEDTELLGISIEDGTATVDLNDEFGDTGLGSSYDGIQIDQVTWTLTQFPTVKRVEYLIDGEVPPEGIGGHGIILEKPQTRKNNEEFLPPIVVEAPHPGEDIQGPFKLTGIANVFEATVSWKLVDSEGNLVKKGFTTATCGTGCWGTFEDVVRYDVLSGAGTLKVFESSAEDGSPLHIVEIPLTFR